MHIQHPGQVFPLPALARPRSKEQHSWRMGLAAVGVVACPSSAGVSRAKKRKKNKSFSTDLSIKRLEKRLPLLRLSPLHASVLFPPRAPSLLSVSRPSRLSGASKRRTKLLQMALTAGYKQERVCSRHPSLAATAVKEQMRKRCCIGTQLL